MSDIHERGQFVPVLASYVAAAFATFAFRRPHTLRIRIFRPLPCR